MNYKISVITVCLNSEKTIENALRSVLVQDYSSVEYIVIDGCSSDNTNVIVSDYEKDFVERGYDFIHLIEKDTGIFDAMNKGITIATGDWIIFLNSDDSFFDSHVLSQVFNEKHEGIDCIYGDVMCTIGEQKNYRKAFPIDVITYRNPYVHQALFVKKSVIEKYKFNLKYKYSADFDQAVRMYLAGKKFEHVNMPIVNFSLEGASQQNYKEGPIEFEKIRRANGIGNKNLIKRYIIYFAVYLIKGSPALYRFYVRLNEGTKR